jgi:hypothetical protein
MKMKLFAGAAVLALGLVAAPAMAQDIDTTGAHTGDIYNFGVPNTATYGQTFTVGGENVLNSFSMYLVGSADEVDFRAYIYAWDGGKATGNALFASAIQGYSNGTQTPTEFAFATPGLTLDTGSQYVAFLSTSAVQIERPYVAVGMPGAGDVYAGGSFVYLNNGADFAALTRDAWTTNYIGNGDVQFKADFSGSAAGVPEPAAWGMLIGGFGLAGAAMRTRARKAAIA